MTSIVIIKRPERRVGSRSCIKKKRFKLKNTKSVHSSRLQTGCDRFSSVARRHTTRGGDTIFQYYHETVIYFHARPR